MAGIDRHAVLPQCPEQGSGVFAGMEPGCQICTLTQRDVDCPGVFPDQMEPFGHRLKGEFVLGILHQRQDSLLILALLAG